MRIQLKKFFNQNAINLRTAELLKLNKLAIIVFPFEYMKVVPRLLRINLLAVTEDRQIIDVFLADIDTSLQAFARSILIDVELCRYRPSLITLGLLSVYKEIRQREMLNGSLDFLKNTNQMLATLDNFLRSISKELLCSEAYHHIENFGRYVFLRQRRIFKVFCS